MLVVLRGLPHFQAVDRQSRHYKNEQTAFRECSRVKPLLRLAKTCTEGGRPGGLWAKLRGVPDPTHFHIDVALRSLYHTGLRRLRNQRSQLTWCPSKTIGDYSPPRAQGHW